MKVRQPYPASAFSAVFLWKTSAEGAQLRHRAFPGTLHLSVRPGALPPPGEKRSSRGPSFSEDSLHPRGCGAEKTVSPCPDPVRAQNVCSLIPQKAAIRQKHIKKPGDARTTFPSPSQDTAGAYPFPGTYRSRLLQECAKP